MAVTLNRWPQASPGEITQGGEAAQVTTPNSAPDLTLTCQPQADSGAMSAAISTYGESGVLHSDIFPGIDRPEYTAKRLCILYKLWDYYKDHTPDGVSVVDYWASPFPYSFVLEMERLGYAYREGNTIRLIKNPCWLSITRRRSQSANYAGSSFDSPYFRDLPYRKRDWV